MGTGNPEVLVVAALCIGLGLGKRESCSAKRAIPSALTRTCPPTRPLTLLFASSTFPISSTLKQFRPSIDLLSLSLFLADLCKEHADELFSCKSGAFNCVSRSFVCDGENDCDKGEDEHYCGVGKTKSVRFDSSDWVGLPFSLRISFECRKTFYWSFSVKWERKIGGVITPGANNSLDPQGVPLRIPFIRADCESKGLFRCVIGHPCIPGSWKCDGDNDCIDGSDETTALCGTSKRT